MQGMQKIEVDLASQIDKNPTSPFVGFSLILLAREQQATFIKSSPIVFRVVV